MVLTLSSRIIQKSMWCIIVYPPNHLKSKRFPHSVQPEDDLDLNTAQSILEKDQQLQILQILDTLNE